MALSVMVHIHGEDAFLGELDYLPNPNHNYIPLRNIRKRDGKPLAYVTDGATAFLYLWSRITFLEALGDVASLALASGNGAEATRILGFFREDGGS